MGSRCKVVSDVSHFLVTSSRREKAVKLALSAFNELRERGYNVILDSNLDGGKEEFDESNQQIDAILVFGGDGTILKTLKRWINIPILGINCGRVGFLTEIEPDELIKAIEKFERNEFFYEKYTTLSIESVEYPNPIAVNDIVVISDKTGRIITLKVSINNKQLYTFNGDGIIIASTTGSSAYSRSAGGPLIMPTVDAFSIVAICPFLGRVYPLVVPPETEIKVINASKYRDGNVVIDGEIYCKLKYEESITVTKSEKKVNFVRFSDNYVERVREKLLKLDPDDINEE